MKFNLYNKNPMPKVKKTQIFVDEDNNAVLIPINNKLIPFHIACIKNVTKNSERNFASLRINF